jgi:hypothetical protein
MAGKNVKQFNTQTERLGNMADGVKDHGDEITIPERLATVKVIGGVNFPSSVLFEKGKGMDYYIKAAGGYIKLADRENVTVRLVNGKPISQKRFIFWKY